MHACLLGSVSGRGLRARERLDVAGGRGFSAAHRDRGPPGLKCGYATHSPSVRQTTVALPAIRAWPLSSRLRWPRSVFGIGGAADRRSAQPQCSAAVWGRWAWPAQYLCALHCKLSLHSPGTGCGFPVNGAAGYKRADSGLRGWSRAGYGVHACSDSDSSGRVLQRCSSERPEAIPWVNVGAAPANGVRGRRQGSGCQHAALVGLVGRATETGSAEGACFVSIRRRVGPRGTRVGRCGWQPCAARCLGKKLEKTVARSQITRASTDCMMH